MNIKDKEGVLMAVQLQFINVIVPIKNIEEKCLSIGGWSGFLELEGDAGWYDEHLYRTEAMNPMDTESIVKKIESYGLTPTEHIDGEMYWKDLCVVDSFAGPHPPV